MDGRLFTVAGVALGLSLLGLVNPYKDSAARWDQNDLGEFGSVSESPDQWRGSSLGMTITGWAPGRFEVETVRPGLAAATAGVYPGDQLIKVGDIDLLTQGRKQLTDYLKTLPPNTKIPVKVSRTIGPSLVEGSQENGGSRQRKKQLNLMLSTDSEAMLDGWLVAEHLQANPVIHHSLKLRGELKRLETLKTQILHGVKKSKSPRIAYERINRWIDQLGVSHAAILPAWGYARLTQRASGGIGLILKRLVFGGRLRYFVVDLQAGGPAGVSELKIGDEVVEVNGVPLDKSARLVLAGEEHRQQLFTVTSAAFESLTLTCRKTASGGLVRIQLKTDSKLSAVSASRSSLCVIPIATKRVGYYRVWNLMSMEMDRILRTAMDYQFKDCAGLIIDLRGRGGVIPVAQRMEQTILDCGLPVIVIVDRHSRSAKEILAIRLKGSPAVKLVGQTTSGSVAAASFAKLPSGNALMFPVTSGKDLSRFTRDVDLEGRGVTPDVCIDFDLPYLQGRDPLLEAAKKQLRGVLTQTKAEKNVKSAKMGG